MTSVYGVAALQEGALRLVSSVLPGWCGPPPSPHHSWIVGADGATNSPQPDNFFFLGRLDNAEELSERVGLRPAPKDATIARSCFEAAGAACADWFEGDWIFSAWDPGRRRLELSRDAYGNSAWFYHRSRALLTFANHLPTLVGLVRPTEVDPLFLAGQLTAFNAFPDGRTAYRDITRVLPGHTVTVTPEHIRCERYWRLEDTPVDESGDPVGRVEAFGSAMRRAVQVRVRSGRTASTLSGGLDSSSVTALAAETISHDRRRLLGLTARPLAEYRHRVGAGGPGDESVLAAATAGAFDNIDHVCFDAADVSPLDGVRRMLAIQGQPGIAAANYYWIIKMLDLARAGGTQTLLTAQMGNGVWSWYGQPPNWRAPFRVSWRAGVLSTVSRLSPSLVAAYRRWQQPLDGQYSGRPLWQAYSAVRPEFATAARLAEQMADAGYDPTHRYAGRSDHDARFALLKPARTPIGAFWSHLGQAFGVTIADPSQDKTLLKTSWAMPARLWWQDQPRWVVRQVMQGRLPDSVRLHPGGHFQSADLAVRLGAETDALEEALRQIAASPLAAACVDVPRCSALLAQMAGPRPPSLFALKAILMRGLDTGLFLASIDGRDWPTVGQP